MKPPAELDRIANAVLAYRPKAKTSKAKKRQRARRKIQRDEAQNESAALRKELALARKDAKRYRWLRTNEDFTMPYLVNDEFDAYIDAAIDAARKGDET